MDGAWRASGGNERLEGAPRSTGTPRDDHWSRAQLDARQAPRDLLRRALNDGRRGTRALPGHPTWYRDSGGDTQRTPLLLLHGGHGRHVRDARPGTMMPAATGRRVIRYDQIGCGRSSLRDVPHDPDMWSIALFVEEIDSLRAHLGLSSSSHPRAFLGRAARAGVRVDRRRRYQKARRCRARSRASRSGWPSRCASSRNFRSRCET